MRVGSSSSPASSVAVGSADDSSPGWSGASEGSAESEGESLGSDADALGESLGVVEDSEGSKGVGSVPFGAERVVAESEACSWPAATGGVTSTIIQPMP